MKSSKGFSLIELLVVGAIVVILSFIVIAGIISAQKRAQITNIKKGLESFQMEAFTYHQNTRTYEGLCDNSGGGFHPSVQNIIDELKDIAGETAVECIVLSPEDFWGNSYQENDRYSDKNFGLAVTFDKVLYAIDRNLMVEMDDSDDRTSGQINNNNVVQFCKDQNKIVPSIEIILLHPIRTPTWSSTLSSTRQNQGYRRTGSSIDEIQIRSLNVRAFGLCGTQIAGIRK